jgi:hypothetical protein
MAYSRPVAFVLAVGLCGCTGPMRTGEIIQKYARAACIPVRFGPAITPPTRAWDHTLKLRDGGAVHISGAEMPGGQVDVRFQPDGSG